DGSQATHAVEENVPSSVVERGLLEPGNETAYLDFFAAMRRGEEHGATVVSMRAAPESPYQWLRFEYTLLRDAEAGLSKAVISYQNCTEEIERDVAYRAWEQEVQRRIANSDAYVEANLTQDRMLLQTSELGICSPDAEDMRFSTHMALSIERTAAEDRPMCLEKLDRQKLIERYHAGVREDAFEYRLEVEGCWYWFSTYIQLSSHPYSGDILGFFAINNIDAQRREAGRLNIAASQDSMTGLLNKAAVQHEIERVLATLPEGAQAALFMIDIDTFKQVNDTFGHQQGDRTLSKIASAISDCFRADDLVGRIGGDEFLAFIVGADASAAHKKAARLLQALEFTVNDITLTASIGVVLTGGEKASYEMLYALADQAMYQGKHGGKGRYCVLNYEAERIPEVLEPMGLDTVQLQKLLEFMDGGILLCAVDGNDIQIVYSSPSLRLYTRGSGQEGGGRGLLSIIHPDDLPALHETLLQAAREGSGIDSVFRIEHEGIKWIHMRGERMPDSGAEKTELVMVVSDVTELKRAEAAMLESERAQRLSQYTAALAGMFDEVYELDWQRQLVTLRYSKFCSSSRLDEPMDMEPALRRWCARLPNPAEAACLYNAIINGQEELLEGVRTIRYSLNTPKGVRRLQASVMYLDEGRGLLCNINATGEERDGERL
ncbi:MAG: diguanylate cyclase, partial [Clostridia bacterium]|nr:diguanylate cyclase [Clostridia bacterium]